MNMTTTTTATTTATPSRTIETSPAKRPIVLWAVIGVAVVALVALLAWWLLRPTPPDPKGDPVAVAKFVATDAFNDLDYDEQREYMATLRRGAEQVAAAHAAGQLDEREYKIASLNVWLERKLDKMDDYFGTKPGKEREEFLDEIVNKKLGKAKSGGGAAATKPETAKTAAAAAGGDSEEFEERMFLKARKNAWPDKVEAQWDEYDDAVDARLAREKERRAAEAAAAAGGEKS